MIKMPVFNSLKSRLIFSAGLMIFILLPIIGFLLKNAFENQLISSIKNELSAYSYSILAVAEVENNQLVMPELLVENQFNVIQSGLYATITALDSSDNKNAIKTLWRSHSFFGVEVPSRLPSPVIGNTQFTQLTFANESHFVFSFSVSFSQSFASDVTPKNLKDFPISIHIVKNLDDFEALVEEFQQQLWAWLIVLILLLIFVQIFWLIWTLKPLTVLKNELEQVEQGQMKQLEQLYPKELAQVTNQLNLLLHTEQRQRQRYRNALSDLAHSLKTPLAVMQSQSELTKSSQQQLSLINQMIEHQLKRAQSAGESSWHLGVKVQDVLERLINSLHKIYRDKDLYFEKNCDEMAVFKGDEADLLEMLGNVLDNACKAAKSTIFVSVIVKEAVLTLIISDDGPGISAELTENILSRGVRADTYRQGHGIGLAIVRDLVLSYQGKINISHSVSLGGAEFTLTFSNKH